MSAAEFAIVSERRRDQAVRLHLGRAALTASATSSCGPVMAVGLDGAGAAGACKACINGRRKFS
jgi:hypothetical protein